MCLAKIKNKIKKGKKKRRRRRRKKSIGTAGDADADATSTAGCAESGYIYTDISEAPAARTRNQKAQRPSSRRPHFNPLPALPHLLISSPIGQSGVNTAPEASGRQWRCRTLPNTAPTPLNVGGSEIYSPALSGAGRTDCGPQRNLVTVGPLAASQACLAPSRLD